MRGLSELRGVILQGQRAEHVMETQPKGNGNNIGHKVASKSLLAGAILTELFVLALAHPEEAEKLLNEIAIGTMLFIIEQDSAKFLKETS